METLSKKSNAFFGPNKARPSQRNGFSESHLNLLFSPIKPINIKAHQKECANIFGYDFDFKFCKIPLDMDTSTKQDFADQHDKSKGHEKGDNFTTVNAISPAQPRPEARHSEGPVLTLQSESHSQDDQFWDARVDLEPRIDNCLGISAFNHQFVLKNRNYEARALRRQRKVKAKLASK